MRHLCKENPGGTTGHGESNAHVGTGAFARPVEQSSTAVSYAAKGMRGFVRRQKGAVFLSAPLCPSWLMNSSIAAALLVVIALTSACRLDMHVQPRQNPLSYSDFYADHRS